MRGTGVQYRGVLVTGIGYQVGGSTGRARECVSDLPGIREHVSGRLRITEDARPAWDKNLRVLSTGMSVGRFHVPVGRPECTSYTSNMTSPLYIFIKILLMY
jgi:hypothetical protein